MSLKKIIAGTFVGLSCSLGASNLLEEVNLTPYVFKGSDNVYFYLDSNNDGIKDRFKVVLDCESKEYLVSYNLVVNLGNQEGFSSDRVLYRFGSVSPRNISFLQKDKDFYLLFEEPLSHTNYYQKKTVKLKIPSRKI